MNWSQFKVLSHESCWHCGSIVVSWSLTQEVAGSNPFTVVTNIYRPHGEGNIFRNICLPTRGGCAYFCLLGDLPTRGVCLLGVFVWGISVKEGLYPGVSHCGASVQGVSLSSGSWKETPGSILLECILNCH